jgi:hypothetical protein
LIVEAKQVDETRADDEGVRRELNRNVSDAFPLFSPMALAELVHDEGGKSKSERRGREGGDHGVLCPEILEAL